MPVIVVLSISPDSEHFISYFAALYAVSSLTRTRANKDGASHTLADSPPSLIPWLTEIALWCPFNDARDDDWPIHSDMVILSTGFVKRNLQVWQKNLHMPLDNRMEIGYDRGMMKLLKEYKVMRKSCRYCGRPRDGKPMRLCAACRKVYNSTAQRAHRAKLRRPVNTESHDSVE